MHFLKIKHFADGININIKYKKHTLFLAYLFILCNFANHF